MTVEEQNILIQTLEKRFKENMKRHQNIKWQEVENRLLDSDLSANKLFSLNEMELTGGEPDVIGKDQVTGEVIFCDCSLESPKGRRSVCYDRQALESRKKYPPQTSAMEMAKAMGIEILNAEQYRKLQDLGPFDQKTSSWLITPADIRKLGGAIFGDYHYGNVFIYHNGAESYYSSRGFRGWLRV